MAAIQELLTPDAPQSCSASDVEKHAAPLLALSQKAPGLHIYTAASPHFERLQRVTGRDDDTKPAAVIRPESEAEVVEVVKFCSTHGIPMAIRSGGQDQHKRSLVRDPSGVSLDMRSLASIEIAKDRKSATIGGGVLTGGLLETLDKEGLTTPTSFASTVGYVGWACGGGYSLMAGMRGMGVDQILGGRVVTADGQVIDTDDDPELLWALRGAGAGIVGVVTQLRIRIYPVGSVLAGHVIFPLTEVPKVMGGLGELFEKDFPDKFAGEAMVVGPPGQDGIMDILFHWMLEDDKSDLEEAHRYLEQIKSLGTCVSSTVEENTPWGFIHQIPNPDIRMNLQFCMRTLNADRYSSKLGELIASRPVPSPSAAVILHYCHGVGAQPNADACFWDRGQHLLVALSASTDPKNTEKFAECVTWSERGQQEMIAAGLARESRYYNFSLPEAGDGQKYFGPNGCRRLKVLKQRLDSKNYFAQTTADLGP